MTQYEIWMLFSQVCIISALVVIVMQGFERDDRLTDLETRQDPERYRDF